MAGNQNVDIELALQMGESLLIAPGNDLVPMAQTKLEVAKLYDLVIGVEAGTLVEVALHDMNVRSQRLQIVECLLRAEVSCAKNVLDLAGYQHLLELLRQCTRPMWDMKVSDDQDKWHFPFSFGLLMARKNRKVLLFLGFY